jgi:hypothetical protein
VADPPSLTGLIRSGVLDAELAALVWVLVEARIPLVVAAPPDRVPAGVELATAVLGSVAPERALPPDLATPLDAAEARALIAGVRPAAVVGADSLEAVRSTLAGPGTLLTEDELSFLGCVLVLATAQPDAERGRLRVVAAHYVRPVALDAHGHRQLLGPAVLATWDAEASRYEHFDWGVMPEIAARLGRRTGDLDADLHHRRDDLAGLAAAGVTRLEEVQRLVAGYRVGYGHPHGSEVH